MIKNNPVKKESPEKPDEYVWTTDAEVAHRGLHDKARPENTLAACVAAMDAGYAIEVDVMVLDDGEVIVFHDRTLDRMTKGHGRVQSRPYAELKRYEIGETEENIPLLRDVCDLVRGRVPLFVELKSDFFDMRSDMRIVYKAMEGYGGNAVFVSFDSGAVALWESAAKTAENSEGHMPAGQIFHGKNIWGRILCTVGWFLYGKPGTILLAPKGSVQSKFFQNLRARGRKVLAWTITSQSERRTAYKYANNIIFDQFSG